VGVNQPLMKAKPPSQKPGVEVIPAAPLWAGTRGGRGSVTKGRKGVRLLRFYRTGP
jgi:hypothetical protein